MKRLCGLHLERSYTGLNRDSDAVKVGLKLNRLYPNDPEVLYHNGRIFGNFAFLTMQRLAQAAPDSVWRHQAAAEAYESQGPMILRSANIGKCLRQIPAAPEFTTGSAARCWSSPGKPIRGRPLQRH